MIKKVYIIWWWAYYNDIDDGFWKVESEFLSWNIKNQSYELMITKWFIDKYWKENVKNCRIRASWEYKNIFRWKWYSWKYLELFKELWKDRKHSIIMFHWVYPRVLMYALIPARHKCLWRHLIIWPYNRCEKKFKRIILWLIQKFCSCIIDTIFYVNDYEKKELIKYKYRWNKFFLPIPINTDFRKQTNNDKKSKKIFHIASTWVILPRKNQKIIVEAIKLIKEKNPNIDFEIDLIWVNEDLNYKRLIEENSTNLKVRFIWFKTADELKGIYKTTDIYIQASFSEWLCQTYIEACLSWCTLILSDIPTFTDTAKDCALFFNPLDAKDLADKILYMVEHIDEYRQKSRKLAKEFEKFGYESFYKQLNEFINTKVK